MAQIGYPERIHEIQPLREPVPEEDPMQMPDPTFVPEEDPEYVPTHSRW